MAQVQPEIVRLYFEDILDETGWGLYYRLLIGISAACSFCQALAYGCISFALPLINCESFLSANSIILINMCFYFGRAIGGYVANTASDICGRTRLIPNSLIFIFASSFLAAFSHGTSTISIAAFILGSGLEVNTRCTKCHLAEILPKRLRGFYLIIQDLFWTLGFFLITGVAWALEKNIKVEHRTMDLRLTAWRLLFALIGGFSILIACTTALMQPSPRFLLFKKKTRQCLSLLKQFYAINLSKYSENFVVVEGELNGIISDYNINQNANAVSCSDCFNLVIRKMFRTTCLLFKRRFIARTVTLVLLKMCLFLGILPLLIWNTKFLLQPAQHYLEGVDIFHLHKPINKACNYQNSGCLFKVFMLMSINIFTGQIAVLFLVDWVGRRLLIFTGFLVCGLSNIILGFVVNSNILFYAIISSIIVTSYSILEHTINIVIIECYPTAVRGTAAGVTNLYPNLIFCIMYTVLYISSRNLFLVFGWLMIVAALLSYLVPELKGQPMIE